MGSIKKKLKTSDKEIVEVRGGWGHLENDLLTQIFGLLAAEELIRSISLVCREWRLACGVVLFWKDDKTLDLGTLKPLVGSHIENDIRGVQFDQKLLKALKCAMEWPTMEGCQTCIRNIIFAPHMYLKDMHLAFVARRSPKLKKLMLPASNDVTVNGVSRIIKNWRELEELSIGPLHNEGTDRFFRTMGSNCKNLTRLDIFGSFSSSKYTSYFLLDEYNASIIAENLLQLSLFSMDKAYLHKSGVWTLLSESKNLEELNLRRCCGIVDPPISSLIITPMRYLKNEISLEIKSCSVKNSMKWSIDGSFANIEARIYTTEELVNELWTASDVGVTYPRYCWRCFPQRKKFNR